MRHAPDAVMMFAAGFGTRMQHLTKDQPNPMLPVAGKPLSDHALDLARGGGLRRAAGAYADGGGVAPRALVRPGTPDRIRRSIETS